MRIRRISYYRVICLLSLFSILAAAFETKSASMIRAHEVPRNQMLKLSVDDRRPLAAAANLLQDRHGILITYEDPRFLHESGLVDETDPKYRREHPNGFRALTPKGGLLEIDYMVSSVTGKPEDPGALIQTLLDADAAANNPGRFRFIQAGQFFHIIPAQVKNSLGQWVDQASVLDTRISFPKQERNVIDTIKAISTALSQATRIKFVVNSGSLNLSTYLTTQNASNEPAREVLVSTLKSTNRRLSWRLLYSVSQKMFVLNLHSVLK